MILSERVFIAGYVADFLLESRVGATQGHGNEPREIFPAREYAMAVEKVLAQVVQQDNAFRFLRIEPFCDRVIGEIKTDGQDPGGQACPFGREWNGELFIEIVFDDGAHLRQYLTVRNAVRLEKGRG